MISMDKKYKTRSGLKVRLLCIDRKGDECPVIGLVDKDGCESVYSWHSTGVFYTGHESAYDLIEVPPVCLEPWKWYKQGNHMYCTVPSDVPNWVEIYSYSSRIFTNYRINLSKLTYLSDVLPGAVEISQPKEMT